MSSKFISTPLWAPLATLIIRAPFLIILFLSNKFERIKYDRWFSANVFSMPSTLSNLE